MRSLRLALSLLTIIPARAHEPDANTARNALLLAPLAGLAAGVPGLLLLLVADGPPLVLATLSVGSLAAMTGALHWDGLADTADGFAVPAGRSDRLGVMRQPDLGPVGALTLGLVLMLQVAALAALISAEWAPTAWLLTVVVSRATLAVTCLRGTPIARPDGLGSSVIGCIPPAAAIAVAGLAVGAGGLAIEPPVRGIAAMLAAFAAAGVLRWVATRRIGGVTGDVLGASVEIAAAACLVAFCLSF